jgi:hypothetical protein
LAFSDAEPSSNRLLNEYEELQFLNQDVDELVAIRKTELQGDLYDTVLYGDQAISYPRPFLFALTPLESHPNYERAQSYSRIICLYDNAGEHFLPGQDTAMSPVTRHLARSSVLFYLFDPTQDPRIRGACAGKTEDPQMLGRGHTNRQETVLLEAADRIRRHVGLAANVKHQRPLVVVVTKYDAWSALLDHEPLAIPWAKSAGREVCAVDVNYIEQVSDRVRELLNALTPELVAAAECLAQRVVYIPVSAIGRSPELDAKSGRLGVRPKDICPLWAEVPMLYAMTSWMSGLIAHRKRANEAAPLDSGEEDISRFLLPPTREAGS